MTTTAINGFQYPDFKVNKPWGFNVGSIDGRNPELTTGGVIDTTTNSTGFARDKFPTAQAFKYHEYLNGGGESNWSIIS